MAGLRPIICEGYCAYFKPGAKEDLACGGLTRAEFVLMRMGKPPAPDRGAAMSEGAARLLEDEVCSGCPFRIDGCDYADRVEGAEPCGGFVYLALLMDGGMVSADDIRRTR